MSPVEFVHRGQALVERGQYQEAVKVCRLGLLAHPTHLDGRLLLGTCLLALRRYDEVLAEMRVALEIDGANSQALALRGEALLRKGDAFQAAEVLSTARDIDPGSRRIRNLLSEAETESQSASGAATLEPLDSMTKHYPAHRGMGARGPGGSGGVTRPTSALRGGFTPSPRELAVGDRSGTIEIDPALDGIEMIHDEFDDPLIEPPQAIDESDVVELASYDLIEEPADELPLRSNIGEGVTADEPTAHYRKQQIDDFASDVSTGAAGKRGAHGPVADFRVGTGAGTSPETPMAKPLGRMRSAELEESAAAIVDMFDDESGISKLTELPEANTGGPLPRSRSEDMRTIRAGLDFGAEVHDVPAPLARKRPPGAAPLVNPANKRNPSYENTEHIKRPKRRSGWDPEEVSEERVVRQRSSHGVQAKKKKKKPRKGKIKRAARRGKRQRSGGRGRGRWIVYAAVILTVGGGAVYGGLKIRELRLDKDIQSARDKAKKAAKGDAFLGLMEARRHYEKIVSARSSVANRAALARMTALIAYELGDVRIVAGSRDVSARAHARELVVGLGKTDSADALAARAYLALVTNDPAAASKLADELSRRYADDPDGPYLAGAAALGVGEFENAEKHFRRALRLTQRPSVYVGLGSAQAGLKKRREAIEAFKFAEAAHPDHPAAVIAKARVMAAMPSLLSSPDSLDDKLDRIRKEGKLAPSKQTLGASESQAAWAGLTLVEVKLARGKRKEALALLAEVKGAGLVDDWIYSRSLSRLLLKLGKLREARAEAARAAKRWPKRVEARILMAEVALEQGEPAKALAALTGAGKLTDARALSARGRARLATGDLAGATKDLDAALAQRPDLRSAQVARADVDLRIGKPDDAVSRLAKIYNKDATAEAGVIYASALRQTSKRAQARKILLTLTTMANPGRAYLELARLERDAGKFRDARKAYGKAIELQPDAIPARLEAAVLALDTGDAAGAREAVDGLLKDAPGNGLVLVEAARIYILNGKVPRAEKLLDEAAKQPGAARWKLARERGRALLRRRSVRKAATALESAIGLQPNDAETRLLLIDAHLMGDDKGAARKVKQDVLRQFRGQPEAQMAIGRVDLYERREKEALAAFTKARKLYEKQKAPPRLLAEVYYYIGQTQYYIGKLKPALATLKRAIALDSSQAYAYFFVGLIELERPGRARAAMSAMQSALDRAPIANPDAWFYLGDAAYKAKQWVKSKRALQTYLKKVPRGELAKEARSLLSRFR